MNVPFTRFTTLVNVWLNADDDTPIWTGDMTEVPVRNDIMWITHARVRGQYRVIERQWACYTEVASAELYVERVP